MSLTSILGNHIKNGVIKGAARSISMPIALSNGIAKGVITVPAVVPNPFVPLDFSAVFGGCVCAAYSEFPCYCPPEPAPTTATALAADIADFYNSQPDVAQFLYFTAAGNAISYVSILPGLVITSITVPAGFTHVSSNDGLIACQEIKPGRAVVTNPCRVPTANNPYAVALTPSTDLGDMFVGISRATSGCDCECGHKCGCKCFTVVTSGTIGVELAVAPPVCPATGPLLLAYSIVDGKFVIYAGVLPANTVAIDRPFQIKMIQGLSALITF